MSFLEVKAAWLKRVDAQLMQIVENFQNILNECGVEADSPTQVYREGFQLDLHADNISSAVDNLLSLNSELRWAHLIENRQDSILKSLP